MCYNYRNHSLDVTMGNTEASQSILYKNRYLVSSNGTVVTVNGDRALSSLTRTGYARLTNGDSLHRVVYTLFKGNIPHKMTINHVDGNKLNNHIDNLEVLSYRDNSRHAANVLKVGNYEVARKLTDSDVLDIVEALRETSEPMTEIAHRYNVSSVAINRINQGQNYSRLTLGSCNDYPIRSRG